MHDWTSLKHVRWDSRHLIVFGTRYRQKKLNGKFRKQVRDVISDLCRQPGVELLEGHRPCGGESFHNKYRIHLWYMEKIMP